MWPSNVTVEYLGGPRLPRQTDIIYSLVFDYYFFLVALLGWLAALLGWLPERLLTSAGEALVGGRASCRVSTSVASTSAALGCLLEELEERGDFSGFLAEGEASLPPYFPMANRAKRAK